VSEENEMNRKCPPRITTTTFKPIHRPWASKYTSSSRTDSQSWDGQTTVSRSTIG